VRPGTPTQASGQIQAKRPFKPEIKGELRTRLYKYAREKGRSCTNATHWLLRQALTAEGYY
jgi:hypothetical protein